MPKPKTAEAETIPGVLPGDEAKYAAATPEQRAKYHAAVEELRVQLDEAEAGGISPRTFDEIMDAAENRARREGIIGPED